MTIKLFRLFEKIAIAGAPVLLLSYLLTVIVGSAAAQSSPVHAEVDRDTVTTDETVTFSITIVGGDASRPSLPVLDGFQIAGSSSSSQISIVNGVTSSEVTYSYALRPTKTGELIIPAVDVTVDGQTYSSEPIRIQVNQGATPSQPGSPGRTAPAPSQLDGATFFVEAEVDNPTPYLGQQVTYTFRFYQAETLLGQPGYDPPDFAGFWSQQDTEQVQYFIDRNDVTYRVTELRTLLFPTVVGTMSIGPGTFQLPGGLFSSGATLHSDPISVTVRPTPTPAPDSFGGAVGQFSISAELQPEVVAVNEPVTLRVTIEGEGNIEALPNPVLPELPGWRAFESTSTMNTQIANGQISGDRTYEQLLVPSAAGAYTVPAIEYTAFDPGSESYQTVRSEPLTITVTAGAIDAPIPAIPGVAQEPITQLDSDIRHIKPVPPHLEASPTSLTEKTAYWIAWLLPIVAIAFDWAWRRRQAYRANNPDLVRKSQALRRATKLLTQGRRQAQDPHATTSQALSRYLSDKLSQPIGGLTQSALANRLKEQGVDESLVERVRELLAESESGRYAPVGSNGEAPTDLMTEAEQLITELDKVL